MEREDEEFFLTLARRNRLARKLAKIDRGVAPASRESVQELLTEIEILDAKIDKELGGDG